MKKKLAFILLCVLCVIYFICIVLSLVNQFYLLFVLLILAGIIVYLGIEGLILYRKFMKRRMIDPKNDLKRNYKTILLGYYNSHEISDDVLDLRGYDRNFYVDSLLVQRYYSFLAEDGTIIIRIKESYKYSNSTKISVLDYPLLHPVTLLEHGLKSQKYIMYNPFVGLFFIWSMITNKKRLKKASGCIEKSELINFCKLRGINIIIEN